MSKEDTSCVAFFLLWFISGSFFPLQLVFPASPHLSCQGKYPLRTEIQEMKSRKKSCPSSSHHPANLNPLWFFILFSLPARLQHTEQAELGNYLHGQFIYSCSDSKYEIAHPGYLRYGQDFVNISMCFTVAYLTNIALLRGIIVVFQTWHIHFISCIWVDCFDPSFDWHKFRISLLGLFYYLTWNSFKSLLLTGVLATHGQRVKFSFHVAQKEYKRKAYFSCWLLGKQ